MNTATMVSIEMSIGSEAAAAGVCDVKEDIAAALPERRAECSWAE